jgi:sarcosine oxidase subunit alpha
MKRYTTHGMAGDQGRIGGLVGSAVLAQARGLPLSEVGQTKPRPYTQPVPFAALAGGEVREHFKPKRCLPLHDWHEAAGASFVTSGLWLRPLVYSRKAGWNPVLHEARTVRRAVGITDVSTLGKIDVQGADAGRFLDFIYANTFSTLAVGRARYGIMLREDGMLFDDGTTSRLGPEHFLVTTTTANAAAALEHMEFHLQAMCPRLDVLLTDVGDQWAQFAVAGPRSRQVVATLIADLDLSSEAFPFMAASAATIAGVAGRVFRISFSGELAYELAIPASHALPTWSAVLAAGRALWPRCTQHPAHREGARDRRGAERQYQRR